MSWNAMTQQRIRVLGGVIGIAVLALLLSSCGADTEQELRANLGGEPSTFDPQQASTLPEFSVIRQVFQGLLGFNPDLSLEPVVAVRVPSVENGGVSEDGLSYTFQLRDDVTWSDGQSVTAGDFVYAIKRALDPQVAGRYASLYTVIKGGGEFVSATEAAAGTREVLRDAVAAEASDDHTLRITLSEPNPTFLQKMALSTVFPVRRDMVEKYGLGWTEAGNYMGNGPYVMTEWVHQDHITLEANPNYWGPKPSLSRITFRMITDSNAELAAYKNGELDLAQVPPGTEKALMADSSLGKELIRSTALFHDGLFFNNLAEPFDQIKVRQAFSTAIDRGGWIDKVKNGVGMPATSWLPPEMP